MIPQISQAPGVVQLVLNFLQALEQQGFTGDTATSYADRLTMSTDNSIYQLLPDAVVFPRSTADVALLARLAAEPRFTSLIFTPRGGGTGTNGQALNQGIIVDMSRYMNRIIEINPEEGWGRVEAGVIKDQLNQALKPYGYFFAPELSTSNRATLGGMINTDASGQGSLVYGKTSDHVLGIRAVLLGGDILDTQSMPVELARTLGENTTTPGRIYQTVYQSCLENRQLILDSFPKLNRFLTGYDLRHVFNDDMTRFDLTRILTGSEGTLAFITEARLDITPIPKVRRLVNVKYDSFDSALRNAPFMVDARALSVETVDSKVLNLAREDIVWHSVSELITDVPDKEMLGLNIVEFAGDDEALIDGQVEALCHRLDGLMARAEAGVKRLAELNPQDRNPQNTIHGCQSQVWIVMRRNANGIIELQGDSDAAIVKGLMAVVFILYHQMTAQDIVHFDVRPWFEKMALTQHLTPSRSQGLEAMIRAIRAKAATLS